MSMLTKLNQRLKKYRSTESKEKRKKERAEREVNKLMTQAGKTILETRRLEIKSNLARARAKAGLAKAEELEARAKRKEAEKRLKGEGFIGQIIRELRSDTIARKKKSRRTRKSKR